MKKIILLAKTILVISFLSTLCAQNVDEILSKHFDAVNQKKLSSTTSLKMEIKMSMQGMEVPMVIMQKRPDKNRTEAMIQGMSMKTVFNGKEAWMLNPMMGASEPQQITGEQFDKAKDEADMDGELYNYADKGYKVTLLADENVSGKDAYVVQLNKKDGEQIKYYIDKDDYLILKSATTVKNMGMEMELESIFKDYKKVNDILFPHTIEIISNGQVFQTLTFSKIEINVDIDDKLFEKASLTE